MARRPTPVELREMTGNPSSHPPANPKGIKVKQTLTATAPAWMNAEQAQMWREGVEMVPKNLLKVLDVTTFQAWVLACYNVKHASMEFQRTGEQYTIVTGNGTVRVNPLLNIIRNEGLMVLKCSSEMGFTPTSRMRVKPDGPGDGDEEEPTNPFSSFTPAANARREKEASTAAASKRKPN